MLKQLDYKNEEYGFIKATIRIVALIKHTRHTPNVGNLLTLQLYLNLHTLFIIRVLKCNHTAINLALLSHFEHASKNTVATNKWVFTESYGFENIQTCRQYPKSVKMLMLLLCTSPDTLRRVLMQLMYCTDIKFDEIIETTQSKSGMFFCMCFVCLFLSEAGWAFGHCVISFVQGTAQNCPKLPKIIFTKISC